MRIDGSYLTAVPTLHPAALLYSPGNEESFLHGVLKAVKAAAGVPVNPPPSVRLNPTPGDTRQFFAAHADWAFDLETPRDNHGTILSWAVATATEALVYDHGVTNRENFELFKERFPQGDGLRIVQNGAFDLPILRSYGFEIPWDRVRDTMIAASILDPDDYVNLGHLGSKYLDVWAWKHVKQDLLRYNALDAAYDYRIWEVEKATLAQTGQLDFFVKSIMPLLGAVIVPLNEIGIKLDVAHRKEIQDKWRSNLATWSADMKQHFTVLCEKLNIPYSLPIGPSGALSSKQVATILYTHLKLPEQHHPKTKQVTTDKSALKNLRRHDSTGTVELLLRRSTYKELEVHLNVKPDPDGRVRSRYVLGGDEKHKEFTEKGSARNRDKGPATGRLASRGPNHQNVPREARVIYIPTYPDWSFLEADSSQIELRLTQYFSQDEALAEAIAKDAHLYVTWRIDQTTGLYGFNCSYEDLQAEYRRGNVQVAQARQECKKISLGWSYRMGARKLEGATGIPYSKGIVALEGLTATFPGVVRWWDSLVSLVKQQRYIQNPFGRRRYFIPSEVPAICNFLSQSTAADVLFDGQLRLMSELKKRPSIGRLVATVHDSNLLEGPDLELDTLGCIVRSAMEHPVSHLHGLRLPVNIKTGKNWRDLK